MAQDKLPDERISITHSFQLEGIGFTVTCGLAADDMVKEVQVRTDCPSQEILGGLLDALSITMSLGLQYGVPLSTFAEKLRHRAFGPQGFTALSEETQPFLARSVVDYLAIYLQSKFPEGKFKCS